MKSFKQVMEEDGTGFIFWCIFLVVVLAGLYNLPKIILGIQEAYMYELTIDFILMLVVTTGIPAGFAVLTYNIWFKK